MTKKGKEMNILTNAWRVIQLLMFIVMLAVVEAYMTHLNPETWIENYGVGIILMLIFSTLYIIPIDKLFFRPKKFYFFMILFSMCWILVDWQDLIIFMRTGG